MESTECRERRLQILCDTYLTDKEYRNANNEENKLRIRFVCCHDCKQNLLTAQCLHTAKFVMVFPRTDRVGDAHQLIIGFATGWLYKVLDCCLSVKVARWLVETVC